MKDNWVLAQFSAFPDWKLPHLHIYVSAYSCPCNSNCTGCSRLLWKYLGGQQDHLVNELSYPTTQSTKWIKQPFGNVSIFTTLLFYKLKISSCVLMLLLIVYFQASVLLSEINLGFNMPYHKDTNVGVFINSLGNWWNCALTLVLNCILNYSTGVIEKNGTKIDIHSCSENM